MCNNASWLSYWVYVLCFDTWWIKAKPRSGEIVAQVVEVQRALDETEERVSSLVVMGIGEPFDNYDNLMGFLRIINHEKGLHIGARHMTVSTSGIIPKIYKFAEEDLQINFAISLHAPNSNYVQN